jgi:N-methylhydantoinase B
VVGDMEAQIESARIGSNRFLELVSAHGIGTIMAAFEDLMDYSERLMRDAIRDLPDGTYRAQTYIDGFLDDPDQSRKELPIVVALKVKGDSLVVDLTGTAPQIPDKPINMPLVGTVDCAIWLTIRSILLDTVIYGSIPQNSGLTRPIEIVAPEGCLANPIFARFTPGNQLADTVMKAFAQVVPEQVSAGIGNLRVVAISGLKDGNHWVHMEIMEGSYGGRFGLDGMDAVDTLYANTRNNPVEDIESHIPLRVNRYELRENTTAPGQWRGGIGAVREFTFLDDAGFSLEGDGHAFQPWGFDGGADGSVASLTLVKSDHSELQLPSKVPYFRVELGDKLISRGPCGGGYGDPDLRADEAIRADVKDGLITEEMALANYGHRAVNY